MTPNPLPVEQVLASCPFCGCETVRDCEIFERKGWRIDCNKCNGGFHKPTREQAVAAWNHRAARPSPSREDIENAAKAYDAFVKAREAMNAARPAIDATPAERALYDERYKADHEAEREHFRTAIILAQKADAILALCDRNSAIEVAARVAEDGLFHGVTDEQTIRTAIAAAIRGLKR